jgi:pSer/pThr/pTyr-binding forkhead associated (FHA) protein
MSGKHCEVRYDGNTYKIVDLGSTNGIVLNDKKVRESDLVDGDSFKLGRTEFKFKAIN